MSYGAGKAEFDSVQPRLTERSAGQQPRKDCERTVSSEVLPRLGERQARGEAGSELAWC